jgi:4-hydroxybenzoate polyprenyltransferase
VSGTRRATGDTIAGHLAQAITISRPLLWLNTSMPFLWALARGRRRFGRIDVVFLAFFTFPYNYFLHAVNDLFDYETDQINPRKGGVEGALTPRDELRGHAIASTLLMVPFLLLAAFRLPWRATLSLATLLGLSLAYNAPPLRLKSRPVADSLTNVLYALPMQTGIHATGSTKAVAPATQVFAAWGIAAHALTTITDREEDEAAGVETIAVPLGNRTTAAFAAGWFGVAAVRAVTWLRSGWAAVPFLPYLAMCAAGRTVEGARGRLLYRWFLATNVSLGFLLTLVVIIPLGVAQALYVGAFATALTAAAMLPSVGRAALARARADGKARAGVAVGETAAGATGPAGGIE